MEEIINWIKANKAWLFEGIGAALLLIFGKTVYKGAKKILSWFFAFLKWTFRKHKHNNGTKNHDDSLFISESPADGITREVGEDLIKSWTIKNNGNVIWKHRYLKCVEYVDGIFYPEIKSIKIPLTYPGQVRTFSVKYHLRGQGDFHSKWKMVDENNQIIYPKKTLGLGINISVR